jgi:hypothetical protein
MGELGKVEVGAISKAVTLAASGREWCGMGSYYVPCEEGLLGMSVFLASMEV